MKSVRILVVVLLLASAAFTQQNLGDQSATTEDVLQLFKEMRFEQQMNAVMTNVMGQMNGVLEGMMDRPEFQKMSAEQKEKFRQFMADTQKEALQIYPMSEIMNDFAPVYAKFLTKADVLAITDFYHSPSGKKLLDSAPKISQEGMAVIGPKMQSRMKEYMDRMQQRAETLFKSGDSPTPEGSPKSN